MVINWDGNWSPKYRVDIVLYYCFQIATVEVPEEHMGPVVELLGKRRGLMFDMQGVGCVLYFFWILYAFYSNELKQYTVHNLEVQ